LLADVSDEYQPPESGEEEEEEVSQDVEQAHGSDLEYIPGTEDLGVENNVVDDGDDNLGGYQDKGGNQGDIHMASPPPAIPAEGSSRVTGGTSRGRAVGNYLSLPDASEMLMDKPIPAKGTVRVYSVLQHQPSVHKPVMTFKVEAKPTLGPVLEKVAKFYSPLQKLNYRIFIHEGSWCGKGEFRDAMEDDEEISWDTDMKGQLSLSICAEHGDSFVTSPVSAVPHIGASAVPVSKAVAKQGDLSAKELVAVLNIPEHLAQRHTSPGLRLNYAKYQACVQAQDTLSQKLRDGTWTAGTKKPTNYDIVGLFASKSYWHSYMVKGFHDINQYPILKKWLEGGEDAPEDAEVWGTVQTTYNFSDLQREKERRQQQKQVKGKAKKDDDKSADGKKKKGNRK
jgi:hypothetical protein